MINWKVRIRNRAFWAALIPAVLLLMQYGAAVLGIPLELPQTEQGPGYGGAMLAAVGCGAYPDVQSCAKALTSVKTVNEPDPALTAAYEEKYNRWRQLYPALKGVRL